MTLTLLRLDPVVRSLPRWIAMSALAAMVFMGVAALLAGMRGEPVPLLHEMIIVWIALVIFLDTPGCRERCRLLALTLPISPRQVFLAHVLAVTLSGLAVMVATCGLIGLHLWGLWMLTGRTPDLDLRLVELAIHLVAGLLLAVALLQSPQPRLFKLPASLGQIMFTIATLLGVLALIILLAQIHMATALLPAAAALALLSRTYRALPEAFTILPREPGVETAGARKERREPGTEHDFAGEEWSSLTAARERRSLRYQWILFITTFKVASKKAIAVYLAVPFFVLMGLVLGGGILTGDAQYTMTPITSYLLLAFFFAPGNHLHTLDPLPLSRKYVFALLTIPPILLISLGYGAGKISLAVTEEPRELIRYEADEDSDYYLYVPIDHCEIAWDGAPPDNNSPWGESHPAWEVALYEGSETTLYSPFHTPVGSSLEFVAYQMSRAVEAVYGATIPPDELRDRYLEVDDEGNVDLKGEVLTLQEDYPHLRPRAGGPIFPLMMMAVILLFFPGAAVYLMTFRATVRDSRRKGIFFTLLAVLFLIHVAQYVAIVSRFTHLWVAKGFFLILARYLEAALPGGTFGVYATVGAVLVIAYWAVQAQFQRIEIPKLDSSPDSACW